MYIQIYMYLQYIDRGRVFSQFGTCIQVRAPRSVVTKKVYFIRSAWIHRFQFVHARKFRVCMIANTDRSGWLDRDRRLKVLKMGDVRL